MSEPTERFRRYLADERRAAATYRALAGLAPDPQREALLELAAIEERHAGHWESMSRDRGVPVPPSDEAVQPGPLVARARALGLHAVLAELEQAEREAQGVYDHEEYAAAGMADDERRHEQALRALQDGAEGPTVPAGTARAEGPTAPAGTAPAEGPTVPAHPARTGRRPSDRVDGDALRQQLSEAEPWHRADKSGTLRAAIFGVSDGLVSNAALIMGFAGSGVDNATVAFAGLAGLLAGAFSMAAGEYVSVASQRDVFQREIALEAAELANSPEEEQHELELLYRAKGMDPELARAAAEQIIGDPGSALDTLAREELGLDPDDLGSPVRVAASSFASFAVGAVVPLLAFALLSGTAAALVAVVLTALALLLVGGLVGRLSGAGVVRPALRQLLVGGAAAAVTYAVGRLIGGSVGVG